MRGLQSGSEEVIDSDESSSLSDSSLEEVKLKKRKHKHKKLALPAADATVRMRNTRGIIRRYLNTLEAFKKGKSMKAAFDATGVDRNTIARTAILAELHIAARDVSEVHGPVER
ncbi:hypothetical protein M9458_055144 [Cirrhinus mrigala]|uniref:Uncharacterized protein n=1 Tax=Cirrhinus mrigala TaxID=683832 RepID=A0ABD0MKN9_CIRMR